MIAERLRKAVLQAAIQGKLTQQLPQDGDARDLLGEITAEREQLIREGKIKRQKPLPAITEDEIPFEIPENWCWVRLGDTLTVSSGRGLVMKNMSENGSFLVYGGNGVNGRYDNWFVEKGTLVIGRVGYYCGSIHRVDDRCWVTDNALIVDLRGDIFDITFLEMLLRAIDLKRTSVSTAQPVISGKRIYPLLIPLPPLPEQQRIVIKLEEILPQIDKLQAVEEELAKLQDEFPQKLRNSLLQAAIQGKLTEQMSEDRDARELLAEIEEEKKRLIKEGKIKKQKTLPEITEDEIPFEIPENWCWVRLGAVAALNPRNKIDDDKEVSFIPMASIQDGYGSNHGYEQRSWGNVKSGYTHFAENDIVVAKITPCFQNRKSAIVRGLANGYGAGTTELHVIRPLSERLSNRYLLHLFKTAHFIHNGCLVMTGTAGQQRVGRDYFENLLVPLPPYAEQQRIVAKLEELLPLCDALDVQ